jgi:membrane-bound lytic murein transglycosylase MltF
MQLLPSTARDMGCENLHDPEENLRAGVRYLDWLRTNFFSDLELDEVNQMDFILAAYNAGPGNVRKWRKQAPSRGYDPNVWRDNVEHLAHEQVGVQPIHYVNNIEKFYVAYTLGMDLMLERERYEPTRKR